MRVRDEGCGPLFFKSMYRAKDVFLGIIFMSFSTVIAWPLALF